MKTPPIVSPEAWEAARVELLMNEKAFTRARDRLAAERRQMPWMPVFRTGRALAADRLRSDYPGAGLWFGDNLRSHGRGGRDQSIRECARIAHAR
jgi:Bacterial protein of unknown function (DUF899)